MARKRKHEDHVNHEAWAIPYGDLITLLLAFFVVMYSMSSVNEGKYRVLSDSLNAAFGGAPRSPSPIQVGPKSTRTSNDPRPRVLQGSPPHPGMRGSSAAVIKPDLPGLSRLHKAGEGARRATVSARQREQLEQMSDKVYDALGDLIRQKQVLVRRYEEWLEIEIQTDILFASGSSRLDAAAGSVLDRLGGVLGEFDNRLRIEGHTDDMPIATREFPSNWELSSARAASVVHRFMARGVEPRRMTVMGLAEYQPVAENTDAGSRNRNRRVVIVVLAGDDGRFPLTAALTPRDAAPPPASAPSIASTREHAAP